MHNPETRMKDAAKYLGTLLLRECVNNVNSKEY